MKLRKTRKPITLYSLRGFEGIAKPIRTKLRLKEKQMMELSYQKRIIAVPKAMTKTELRRRLKKFEGIKII